MEGGACVPCRTGSYDEEMADAASPIDQSYVSDDRANGFARRRVEALAAAAALR